MNKEIDINNEEEILKECDFDYFYESQNCSHELCRFYNDIRHQNADFNRKQALIDLGRIGITLNKQQQQLAEKDAEVEEFRFKERNIFPLVENLGDKVHQEKIDFAVEQLEKVRIQCRTKYSWYEEIHRVCEKTDDFVIWLDSQIAELKGVK